MLRAGRVGLVATLVAFAALADGASARDAIVRSFDGTPIVTHFFPADGLKRGQRAPVVMVAHGYGESGPSSRDAKLVGAPAVAALLRAGYNVLTWDARGHGGSGGSAQFDDPKVEGRDTRALIDWASTQPEVQLDRPGDPRLAMTGASYGGLIQFQVAALDRRVDVISPAYTGNSLARTMIAPRGKFKEAWGAFLLGAYATTVPPGVISPAGPQLHTAAPEATAGILEGITSGGISDWFRDYLADRSPSRFVGRVRVPTLLQQGTTDTLFPLRNATRNFRVLKRNGVPVKLVWNCQGHSICGREAGPAGRFDATAIRWFDRWLKRDRSVRTGPQFEWIADNEGEHRSARRFPPSPAGRLRAGGSGSLVLSPASAASGGGFVLTGGSPSADAVNVDLPAPGAPADVVGYPRVKLTYSGVATRATTYLYGQVVDRAAGHVVGGQVTPIPVTLDGEEHTVEQDLETIATRARPSSRYRLQLLGGSLIFGQQRSVGAVELRRVVASLPIIDAMP